MTISDQLPLAEGGVKRFESLAAQLPELLARLRSAPVWSRGVGPLPPAAAGIYVFAEEGRPVYVGQTRNLRRRLVEHGAAAARETQATFAFSLALRDARERGLVLVGSRTKIATHPDFVPLFHDARSRVSQMSVRFVEESDAELRTVLEVYAAVAFGTGQPFETH